MWKAQVFTLYPEIFPGPLNKGLYGKALSKKIWNLKVVNIRDSAEDKHKDSRRYSIWWRKWDAFETRCFGKIN